MYHCLCRDELESQCTGRVTVSAAHSTQPAPATHRPVTQSDADIILRYLRPGGEKGEGVSLKNRVRQLW